MVGATSHAAAIAAATPCDSGNTTTGFLLAMQPSTVLSVPSPPPSTTSTIGSGRVSSIIDDATLDAAIGRLGIPKPDRERPRLSAGVGRSLPRGSPAYVSSGARYDVSRTSSSRSRDCGSWYEYAAGSCGHGDPDRGASTPTCTAPGLETAVNPTGVAAIRLAAWTIRPAAWTARPASWSVCWLRPWLHTLSSKSWRHLTSL